MIELWGYRYLGGDRFLVATFSTWFKAKQYVKRAKLPEKDYRDREVKSFKKRTVLADYYDARIQTSSPVVPHNPKPLTVRNKKRRI